MAITDMLNRFKNQVDTSDKQRDGQLRTHYYHGSIRQIFQSVEEIIRNDADCRIKTISRVQGKIIGEIRNPNLCCLMAKVSAAKPSVTAVDFSISSEKPALLGSYLELKERLISFYERLNMQHPLIEVNKNS